MIPLRRSLSREGHRPARDKGAKEINARPSLSYEQIGTEITTPSPDALLKKAITRRSSRSTRLSRVEA